MSINVLAVLEQEKPTLRCSVPGCINPPEGVCGLDGQHCCRAHGSHPYHFSFWPYGAKQAEQPAQRKAVK